MLHNEVTLFPFPIVKLKNNKYDYNIHDLFVLFSRLPEDSIIGIENVFSMPGQGVSSTFQFGRGKGIVEALSHAISPSKILYVAPQVWKRHHGLIGQPKQKSVELANALYGLSLKNSQDGLADALLISRYVLDKNTQSIEQYAKDTKTS